LRRPDSQADGAGRQPVAEDGGTFGEAVLLQQAD
jgi:hypothetical protein